MATRSMIWQETDQGFRGVYCHYDGYPKHVGRTLTEYYADPESVNVLLDYAHQNRKSLSSLGNALENCAWNDAQETELPSHQGGDATRKDLCGTEWSYVFSGGSWETVNLEIARRSRRSRS